jgi:hypothetical protein
MSTAASEQRCRIHAVSRTGEEMLEDHEPASGEVVYVTGQTFAIDGGRTLL